MVQSSANNIHSAFQGPTRQQGIGLWFLYLVLHQYIDSITTLIATWSPMHLVDVDGHADAHGPASVWHWQPELTELPLVAQHLHVADALGISAPSEVFDDLWGDLPTQWKISDEAWHYQS